MTSSLTELGAVVLAAVLVFLFILNVVLLIGNGLSATGLQSMSKEMDDGLRRSAQLFEVIQTLQLEVSALEFELAGNQEADKSIISRVQVSRQKYENALSSYTSHVENYSSAVCVSITQLHGIWWPATLFVNRMEATKCDGGPRKVSDTTVELVLPFPSQVIYTVRKQIEILGIASNYYVLPILFGCMGAFIFALRDILRDQQHARSLIAVLGYYLRICLGGICGMVIGYINVPTAVQTLSASPLIFSLVAGFSVDAVISILERIATAIRYEEDKSSKRRSPKAPSNGNHATHIPEIPARISG
jgi:hypothetical protein